MIREEENQIMSKKHFIALADMMREHNRLVGDRGPNLFNHGHIGALAGFCLAQNPQFNTDRWINYLNGKCGSNGGKVKQAA